MTSGLCKILQISYLYAFVSASKICTGLGI